MNFEKKSNREHSFDKELAEIVGIEKAILLKNIDYWCSENEVKKITSHFLHGVWWTRESLNSLAKKYPYMKRGNLSRWLHQLHDDKWIRIHVGENGNNYYAPGSVFIAWDSGEDWQKVFQNETGGCFKMKQGVFQNEIHNNVEIDIEQNNVELNIEQSADFISATPETETTDSMLSLKKTSTRPAKKPPTAYENRHVAAFLEIKQQLFFQDVIANGAWADYREHRKEIKKGWYASARSESEAIKDFFICCDGRSDKAQAVVNQSRAKKWQGLFPIKNSINGHINNQPTGINTDSEFFGDRSNPYFSGFK